MSTYLLGDTIQHITGGEGNRREVWGGLKTEVLVLAEDKLAHLD